MNTSNSNSNTNKKEYSVDDIDEVFDGDDEYGNFIDFDDTATTNNNGDNNEKWVGDKKQIIIRDRDRDYSRTGMGGLSLEDNSNLNSQRYSNSNSSSNFVNNNDIKDEEEEEVTDYCLLLDNAMSSTMTIPMTRMSTPAFDQLLRNTSSNTKNYFNDCSRMRSAATATTTATSRSGSQSLYNYFRSENDIDVDSEEEEAQKWRVYTEQQQQQQQDYQEEEYDEEDNEDMETLDDIYNDLLRRRREYHPSENENDVGNDIDINHRKGKEEVEETDDLLLDNMICSMIPTTTDVELDLVTDVLATMRSTTTEAIRLSTNPNQPSGHELDFIADTLDRMRTTILVRATCNSSTTYTNKSVQQQEHEYMNMNT